VLVLLLLLLLLFRSSYRSAVTYRTVPYRTTSPSWCWCWWWCRSKWKEGRKSNTIYNLEPVTPSHSYSLFPPQWHDRQGLGVGYEMRERIISTSVGPVDLVGTTQLNWTELNGTELPTTQHNTAPSAAVTDRQCVKVNGWFTVPLLSSRRHCCIHYIAVSVTHTDW